MVIPAGYSEQDLGVYWYNEELGAWEKLDHVGIDPVTKTLTTFLEHFSEYQVMASQFVSPSLDSYYNLGVSPFQSYFSDNQESVSGASGSLSVSATDLKLPGRSGFDLILKRSYDGEANRQSRILESYCSGNKTDTKLTFDVKKYPVDTFGDGWSFNIPWVESNDGGSFIRLPEGQTFQIESSNFTYNKGTYFKLKTHTHQSWSFIFPTTEIDGYTLTLSDGTVYQLDRRGKPTQETDPSGVNTITYSYNGDELTKINDSLGREIDFSYKQIQFTISSNKITRNVITNISYGGDRTIQYQYDSNGMLSSVTDPMNRVTQYTYEDHTITSGIHNIYIGSNSNPSTCDVSLLKNITYPTGAVSNYQYAVKIQDYSETLPCGSNNNGYYYEYFLGSKILVSSHSLAGKTTSYEYTLNLEKGSLSSPYFITPNTYILTCTITEGQKVTTQTFQQMVQKGNRYHLADIPGENESSAGSLMVSSQTVADGKSFETVNYSYTQLPLQSISKESHSRGGSWAYDINNSYDSWGNVTQRIERQPEPGRRLDLL